MDRVEVDSNERRGMCCVGGLDFISDQLNDTEFFSGGRHEHLRWFVPAATRDVVLHGQWMMWNDAYMNERRASIE